MRIQPVVIVPWWLIRVELVVKAAGFAVLGLFCIGLLVFRPDDAISLFALLMMSVVLVCTPFVYLYRRYQRMVKEADDEAAAMAARANARMAARRSGGSR